MSAIRVRGLSKSYRVAVKQPGWRGALRHLFQREQREVHAVRAVDFDVSPGEMVGFLGANGAGKTTTLKMLTDLVRPSSGQASVLGHVPFERKRAFLQLNGLLAAGRYPIDALPPGAYRFVFTFIVPVALLTTIPAQVALNQVRASSLVLAGVFALGAFVFSRAFWKFALRSYTSASS
jgi:ABC-type dipeptide/oligopeptide/nickel transport system ATPase component